MRFRLMLFHLSFYFTFTCSGLGKLIYDGLFFPLNLSYCKICSMEGVMGMKRVSFVSFPIHLFFHFGFIFYVIFLCLSFIFYFISEELVTRGTKTIDWQWTTTER